MDNLEGYVTEENESADGKWVRLKPLSVTPEIRIVVYEKNLMSRNVEWVGEINHSLRGSLSPNRARIFAAALIWAADYVDAEKVKIHAN